MNTTEKFTAGFCMSYVIMSFVNSLIIIVKEKSPAVMTAMKSAMGHHWTTHGTIMIILFVVLGLAFSNANVGTRWNPGKLLTFAICATVINIAIIAGYYLIY